jgi:hypothetical protein
LDASSPSASDARLRASPTLFANSDSERARETAFEQLSRVTKRVTGSIGIFFDTGTAYPGRMDDAWTFRPFFRENPNCRDETHLTFFPG